MNAIEPILWLLGLVLAIYWLIFPWLAIRWLKKIHEEVHFTRMVLGQIRDDTEREAAREVAEWERKHPPQAMP